MQKQCGLIRWVLVAAVTVITLPLQAMQMAWIDTEQVMQAQRVHIDAALQKSFGERIRAVRGLQESLQADQDRLKRDGALLSDSERVALEKTVRNKAREFEGKRDELNEELNLKNEEAVREFIRKVNGIVETISKKAHYDVVFQKNATLFLASQYDITAQVLQALGLTPPAAAGQ